MPYIYTDDYQLTDEVIDTSLFKKRMSEIKYYDKNKPFSDYHEGQVIYATPAATHVGQSSSYLCPTTGPYKITKVNDVSRELKALKMGTNHVTEELGTLEGQRVTVGSPFRKKRSGM